MAMNVVIQKAKRTKCAACILLQGLSGHGKTGAALTIASALSPSNSLNDTLFVDTENKSVNLFDGIELASGIKVSDLDAVFMDTDDGFSPLNYLACKEEAKKIGKKTVIFDSITHAWNAKDGILDQVTTLKATTTNPLYKKDPYAVWGATEIVKAKQGLFEMVRDPKIHVISTVRVKEKMEYETQDNGKNKLVSMGEQQILQADMKYEFDLVLECLEQGSTKQGVSKHPKVRVTKSRYAIFVEGEEYELTPEILTILRDYLEEGTDPKEIEEQQRQDYLKLMKEKFNKSEPDRMLGTITKQNLGYEDKNFSDLPFYVLKQIYTTIFKN